MKLKSIQQKLQESGQKYSWKGRLFLHLIFIYWGIRYTFDEIYSTPLFFISFAVHKLGLVIFNSGIFVIVGYALLDIITCIVCYLFFVSKKDYYTAFIVPGMYLFVSVYHEATSSSCTGDPWYPVKFSNMVFVVAVILLWGFMLAGGYIIYQMYLGNGKSRLTRAEWELSRFSKRSSRNAGSNDKDGNGDTRC